MGVLLGTSSEPQLASVVGNHTPQDFFISKITPVVLLNKTEKEKLDWCIADSDRV